MTPDELADPTTAARGIMANIGEAVADGDWLSAARCCAILQRLFLECLDDEREDARLEALERGDAE